jgi:hypothetical protein
VGAGDYSAKTVVQLKDVLRSRGLKLGGKKAELIARLHADDGTPAKTLASTLASLQPPAPADSPAEVGKETTVGAVDYSAKTVVQLKDLLRSRGLKLGGKNAELIARLQDDDGTPAKTPASTPGKPAKKSKKNEKSRHPLMPPPEIIALIQSKRRQVRELQAQHATEREAFAKALGELELDVVEQQLCLKKWVESGTRR